MCHKFVVCESPATLQKMVKLVFYLVLILSLSLSKVYAQFAEGVKKYTTGEYEEAIPYLEATLEKDKENQLAKDYLLQSLLTLWERYRQEKKYEKALAFLEKAYKYFPENPRVKELYTTIRKAIIKETPLPPELEVRLKVLAGTVSRVEGKVFLQSKTKKIWTPVEVHSPVYPGDKIKTEENSECEIIFDDGTALKVERNSQITLESIMADDTYALKRFAVDVEIGRVLSNLEKFIRPGSKFGICTPTAIIGVQGTEFVTAVGKDKTTEVAVFDGMVIVAAPTAIIGVSVEKGKQTVVKPGEEPLTPFDLSKEFLDYQAGIVPVFEESVTIARKELDRIIYRRTEWIKKKQEKGQSKALKKVENIDLLVHPLTVEKLELTTEQLKSLKGLKEALEKDKKIKLREVNQAEAELRKLLATEEVDLTKVEIKLRQISALRAVLRYMDIATFENGKTLLTPEQKKKLKELLMTKGQLRGKTK